MEAFYLVCGARRPQLKRNPLGSCQLDPNYDPRDDTDARPQVGFQLKAGSYDHRELLASLRVRFQRYHDMMLFDPVDGEIPGTIRFEWDTPGAVVDEAAEWLRSQSYVLKVFPSYGGPIGTA